MAHSLTFHLPFDPLLIPTSNPVQVSNLRIRSCSLDTRKLVTKVKVKLEKEHNKLPVGQNGRDDEGLITRFLQDQKYHVDETVSKLTKAIKWRHEFGVSELSEESIRNVAATRKAHLHDYLDVHGRPTLIVEGSKQIPGERPPIEDQKLCVYMIEKALTKLPDGQQEILAIVDLQGFQPKNADLKFIPFVFEVFHDYYPQRLGQVLLVDAPFIFKPFWHLIKPLLKSYTDLVRFCSAETVQKEYFTRNTVPTNFRR